MSKHQGERPLLKSCIVVSGMTVIFITAVFCLPSHIISLRTENHSGGVLNILAGHATGDLLGDETVSSSASPYITFRGGPDRSGCFNTTVPDSAASTWTFGTDSMAQGSAAYWNRRIYYGTYEGLLYCIDAATGSKLWAYAINTSIDSAIDSTPAIYNGRVYFGAGDGYLHCVNALNGSPEWTYHTGRNILSSPLVIENIVYFGCQDGILRAINTTTRTEIWNYSTGGEIWASPTFDGKNIYIGSLDGNFYALNAKTGKILWNWSVPEKYIPVKWKRSIYSTAAIYNGTIYVGFGESGPGGVAALDAETGSQKWLFGPDAPQNGSVYSSPAVHDGTVFVHRNLRPPSLAGDYLYAISAEDIDGDGFIRSASEIRWQFKTGENDGGSSPAVADGKVVVASYGDSPGIYAVDEKTGSLLWNLSLDCGIYPSPTLAEGKVFVPDNSGNLHVISSGMLPGIDLSINPESTTIKANQVISIKLSASYMGTPVEGATLRIKASKGTLSQESVTTFPDGTQKVKYWAPQTERNISVIITVTASRAGYEKSIQQKTLLIEKALTSADIDASFNVNWSKYTLHIASVAVLSAVSTLLFISAWRQKRKTGRNGGDR